MGEPSQLDNIEREQAEQKKDIWLIGQSVKILCVLAGAKEQAMKLSARQAERFDTEPEQLAFPDDVDTNPGIDA